MQVLPERDQLAFVIAEAMWGSDAAELYARHGSDVRWDQALRAADAVLTRQGQGPQPPARLFSDPEREGYGFLKPVGSAGAFAPRRLGGHAQEV